MMAGGAQIVADLPPDAWALLAGLIGWRVDLQQASDMRSEVMHSADVIDKVRRRPRV
jgi:hypothetical protein